MYFSPWGSTMAKSIDKHVLTTKNVHFVKLSKCETDFTIAFLSSRRSRNIYGMSNSESGWRSYALGKMPRCREFQPRLGLSTVGSSNVCRDFRGTWRNLLRCLGLSLRREFRQKSEVPTVGSSDPSRDFRHTWQKILFGSGLLYYDPNCSKLVGNLENKAWRGFLLG